MAEGQNLVRFDPQIVQQTRLDIDVLRDSIGIYFGQRVAGMKKHQWNTETVDQSRGDRFWRADVVSGYDEKRVFVPRHLFGGLEEFFQGVVEIADSLVNRQFSFCEKTLILRRDLVGVVRAQCEENRRGRAL